MLVSKVNPVTVTLYVLKPSPEVHIGSDSANISTVHGVSLRIRSTNATD